MNLRNRPIFTSVFPTLSSFRPSPDSAYIFALSSVEERGIRSKEWRANCSDVEFVPITDQTEIGFRVELDGHRWVRLRSGVELREFLRSIRRSKLYLDITGLEHHVWAPLLKSALSLGLQMWCVYLEPTSYRFSRSPREGDIFDLSERIRGLAPLPGFASLAEAQHEGDVIFVSLLGFEGVRFKYCVEQIQPPRNKIIPVIGVPGFQPEYPFYTYDGNRPILDETEAWKYVKFARANCPFSLFYLLQDIASDHPLDVIKIATIGTKPHAVGAVLFSLLSPRSIELIYDHPIRKATRTEGIGRVLLYEVSAMSSVVG
jgi:hypothetical protein